MFEIQRIASANRVLLQYPLFIIKKKTDINNNMTNWKSAVATIRLTEIHFTADGLKNLADYYQNLNL